VVALIKRLVASLVGASLGGFAVAAVEARSALRSVPGESLSRLFLADAGVLAPLALGMGVAFSLAHAVVEPGEVQGPWSRLRSARREPVMTRTHTAALAPLLIVGGFVALVALANVGRGVLGAGTPKESGALLGLSSLLIAFSGAALVAGSFLPLRRVLAAGYSRRPWLLDPVMTGGLALGLSCSAFVLGIRGGDTGGDGAWPLGVFGVLKREERGLLRFTPGYTRRLLLDAGLRAKLKSAPGPTLESLGFEANKSSVMFFHLLQEKGFDHAAGAVKVANTHDPIKLAGDM